MNQFIRELREQYRRINGRDDLHAVYEWVWKRRTDVACTATEINASLRLEPPYDLQSALLCLGVGSHTDLVVLAANPGWHPKRGPLEHAYCVRSPEAYADMMFNFFERHPAVTGKYATFWTRAMSFLPMLPDRPVAVAQVDRPKVRWPRVHEAGILGGWDLFPWHSTRDRLTRSTDRHPWLKDLFRDSVEAVLRLKPKMLFVTSGSGSRLIREVLLPDEPWSHFSLGKTITTKGCYTKLPSGTEVVCIGVQLLGSGFRSFSDEDLIAEVRACRSQVKSTK